MPIDRGTLQRHLNGVFVETGAGPCIGSRTALELGVPRVFVIEFDPEIYERAVDRYRGEPRVQVVFGDAGKVLSEVIALINEPITFWLDAHGKSPETKPRLASKPLLQELAAIAAHPLRLQHTVLIDDYDVVLRPGTARHLTDTNVRDALRKINPHFRLSRVDGLINPKRGPLWLVLIAEPDTMVD